MGTGVPDGRETTEMADATQLRKAMLKVVFCIAVIVIGRMWLWPDEPVREWLESSPDDWKVKFAFIAWLAVSAGMAYDALVALVKGAIASPDARRR
jgi:hypothetical protein